MASKKKKGIGAWVFSVLFLLFVGCGFFYKRQLIKLAYKIKKAYVVYILKDKNWKPGSVNFPINYSVFGLDISHYQGYINWDKMIAKNELGDTVSFQFVLIKATEGANHVDPAYDDYWDDARESKLIQGAYHYFLPNVSAEKQAKNFIETVNLKKTDFPPIIDIEETRGKSKKEIVTVLQNMIVLLEKKYHKKPIIYSNISFINDYLLEDFKGYKFWVAHYYKEELATPKDLQWCFWQFTDNGQGFCTDQPIDINAFYGTKSQLKEMVQ